MKRIAVLLMALSTIVLAACHTVEGMGKDIKKAGETIEKAVK